MGDEIFKRTPLDPFGSRQKEEGVAGGRLKANISREPYPVSQDWIVSFILELIRNIGGQNFF